MTPTVYLNGVGTARHRLSLLYTTRTNSYLDTTQHVPSQPSQYYAVATYWNYLTSYEDTATGQGASSITYQTAHNNTHGTPASGSDNRLDPLYCDTHSDCTGSFANPDDRAWTVQVVTQITASGSDSSAVASAQTSYAYGLQVTETASCPAYNGDARCVGDEWMPSGSSDFLNYYQSEYHGFANVYITSPAGDLTSQTYYSNADWGSSAALFNNYLGGALSAEYVYQGNSTSGPLLRDTVNTYAGTISGENNSCNGNYSGLYTPCAVLMLISRTTFDEGGANANPPWVQQDNTFDDYANVPGASLGFGYNNLIKQVISSSNAPSLTKTWTYTPNDRNVGGWIYHDVNKVTHSELDDSTGNVWSCQNTAYDQGVAGVTQQPPTPAQGLPTTVTTYSDCANQNTTAITSYAGYNGNGEQVASVDGVGTANASFYGSTGLANQNGCTLSSNPAVLLTSWGKANYTTCATYDSLSLQPTSGTNAFGQSSSTAYGPSQQGLPTSTTDANGQVTGLSYSYDSRGNGTIQVSQPGETLGYTTQSSTNANACPASIPTSIHLPCYEIDTSTALYSPAVSRTFYDALGRAVETRSTGPGVYDTVSFTVYNDAAHTVFQSVPFEVVDGSGWLDPNGATDYTGHAPGGTASFYDALGRLVAVQDPLYGTSPDGISCSATLTGTYTACTNYSLGSDSGDPNISDTNIYATTSSIDANNHVSKSFTDALGRTVYTQTDSGGGSNNGPLSPIQQQSVQYNALNEPIQVRVDDLAPQNNQVVTSVLTTAQYDALGRLTQLVDADRGTHTYSYDPDGHLVSDVSGSRTIGTNLDLLGRVGCVQDMAPVLNASGSCTSGSHPLVQNTYDTSKLGTQGSTDFPIGRLTKSLTTTYFPEGGSATTTQKYQYDQRGRVITEQLLLKLPNSWNVSPGPPTYQVALSYTDTNQPTTAITSTVNPTGSGFTSTQVYDPTGALLGLGSSSNPVANLATLSYNVNAQVGSITYLTSTGSSNVAQEQFSYDGNLRPFEASATWQSGSGSSGQIFDQVRNYDAAGNVVSLTTTQASVPGQSSSGGSETENFCYDEQNRLVWAGNSGSQPGAGHGTCGSGTLANTLSGASYTNTFASTNLGQLWKAPVNGTGGYQQYLYCDSSHPHQLTGIYPTGTTCTNPTGAVYSTSYDAWGNVTSRTYSGSTATLSYDQLDRMVEWQNSTTNAQEWYLYDASGNRVLRRSTSNGTTTLTTYPFSSEEHTYSGTGTLQSSIYYYRLGGRLIGDLTGSPAQTNLFLTDALGSVLATFSNTATTAALLGNQTYRPYGSQQYQSGSLGTNKGFTGQYADATGLDYYNARYYDPVAGVFLSADTVQGNTKGMNPYGYVQGNPETWSDPTGAYVACGDTCGQGPGTGSGGGASSPASTSTNTGWLTFPFKIHPPTTPSTPNQNNPNLSPCGGMSIQDCMSLWYATGIHYQGYTTTSIKIGLDGPGFTLYGPTGLIWTGFHSSFTVQTLTPVSGTVVMPLGGCASLFSCLTSNEGVDERLPEDYALFQCSFTASTKVTTQEGTQAIGTLKPGEKVLAYNPKTRQMELQPILHVWINHDTDLVDLTLTTRTHAPHSSVVTTTSEVIHTNKKHPFLTIEHGFLSVGQITLGMHILRADGQVGVVTGWKMVPGGKTMYNLEVQQDHTYTVGVGQWVVHNSDGCGGDNNPFSPGTDYAGDYERQFQSSQGPIGILANGRVEGTTLILEDVAIYPTASEKPLTIGVREILQFRNQIAREVASWGFDTLEIRGLRMPNSTSANPGKVVNLPPINLEPFGP